MDQELEGLTTSLFEEANKTVFEANFTCASSEKKLYETQLKLNGLQAEVDALKLLVLLSTPSNPGNHYFNHNHKSNNSYSCYIEHRDEKSSSIDVKEKFVSPFFIMVKRWKSFKR